MALLEKAEETVFERLVARLDRVDATAPLHDRAHEIRDALRGDPAHDDPFALVLELAYSATDPPLKLLRRLIPPLRIGNISLDLGFIVLFFAVTILMQVVGNYR